jgi:Spy/CpxP family protein refolding chaperone
MNRLQPIKMKVLMVAAAVLGMFISVYCSDRHRSQPSQDTPPERLTRFMFLADSNLVDGRRLLEIKARIGLTAEQEKKIEDLVLEQEAFNIRRSAEIKIKEVRFAAYLRAGKLDRKGMASYIREISAEKTALIVNYINYLLDVRELLTPRQLEILQQNKGKRKTLMRRNPGFATHDNRELSEGQSVLPGG